MTSRVAVYQIKRTFRAPLEFAYQWCIDYTPGDRKLQGEKGSRQILRKTSRGAVYEDLTPTPDGWQWSRQTVTFRPPNAWHAVAIGNYRTWNLEYSLRVVSNARTEFILRGKRRSTPLGVKNPSKAVLEKELHTMWRKLGASLERDYRNRRSQRSRRASPGPAALERKPVVPR
jgi:hypothetical protein